MPKRLRPKMTLAANAILVGDPGRSLLLAQELLEEPKMSNHARGLWGYTGRTAAGDGLTIQATGMGGPSAALVLADLVKLGVERVVRIGTCTGLERGVRLGELLLVTEAIATGGSAGSFGVTTGAAVLPDLALLGDLGEALGPESRDVAVASFDTLPVEPTAALPAAAADMQTVAVLARARELGVGAAAVLIVADLEDGQRLADEQLELVAKRTGGSVVEALSNPKAEG